MQTEGNNNDESHEDDEEPLEIEGESPSGKLWAAISTRLEIVVIVSLLALWWVVSKLEDRGVGGPLFNIAIVAVIVLVIVGGVAFAISRQRRIAKEAGLVCRRCGYSPRGLDIRDTELVKECMKCGTPLHG